MGKDQPTGEEDSKRKWIFHNSYSIIIIVTTIEFSLIAKLTEKERQAGRKVVNSY